jgi:hypothetical protein
MSKYVVMNLLGPYNSGTNLINNLLRKYLISPTDGTTIIWKHSLEIIKIVETIEKYPYCLFIVSYRPLYSWIKSIEKISYDIKWNKEINGIVEFNNCKYNTIIELYEKYYIMYKSLIEKYDNVIALEYYKICDINTSYDYMSKKLKDFNIHLTDRNNYIHNLNSKSKHHGDPVSNSNEAIQKKQIMDMEQSPDLKINNEIITFYECE